MLQVASRTVRADSPAMADALAAIERAFGPGSEVRDLKRRCRRVLRFPQEPAWRGRYGARAAHITEAVICHHASNGMTAPCLHIAINIIERHYRNEKPAMLIALAIGRGNRLSLQVLSELRLILRFLRRHGEARDFPKMLAEFAS